MPQLDPKPEPFRPGSYQISAEDLNKIVRSVVRQIRGGGNTTVDYFGDRVAINSFDDNPQVPDIANYIAQFIVLQEFDDYLLCAPFPFSSAGNVYAPPNYSGGTHGITGPPIYIAKSFWLQKTPFGSPGVQITYNGQQITLNYTGIGQRTTTNVSTGIQQKQLISPPYQVGDYILAARMVTGYYDPTPSAFLVSWIDLNSAGRIWSALSVQTVNPGTGDTPFTENYVSIIEIDQKTGINLIDDGGGVARIQMEDATLTHSGVVNLTTQDLGTGPKKVTGGFLVKQDTVLCSDSALGVDNLGICHEGGALNGPDGGSQLRIQCGAPGAIFYSLNSNVDNAGTTFVEMLLDNGNSSTAPSQVIFSTNSPGNFPLNLNGHVGITGTYNLLTATSITIYGGIVTALS